ncbi:MFS transporter [Oceanobacillus alkalisoli]|uniref:MFS transporter n=1 Tax=Oceanobacillus alkalisoli TaxID=2925113 RepID=UPI001F121F30|nr:MFS transporter [Oceanobacillus alkalisoli]MCF3944347.1 MFS transporter [Oceanobacillus alkalisoli]
MTKREKLWTKDFIMVSTTNFLLFVSFYILMVTLAMYSIEQFNVSGSIAGLASSIFVLGAVLVRPVAGNLIATVGRKKLLIFGLALFLVMALVYFPVNTIGWMLLIRFVHGFAFGITTTATGTIAVDVIPPSRRGEGLGYFATSNNFAMAIGPFVGLITLQYLSQDMIFVITTGMSIIALVTALFMNVPEIESKYLEKEKRQKRFKLSDYFEGSALPISIFMLIVGVANSSILSFISTYAVEINLVDAASFFFVMYAVFLLLSRPVTGRMYDEKGENSVMYPSIALFGIGLVILSQASNGIFLLIAGAIIGVGFGTLQSSAQTIAVSTVPHQRVGLATATFFTFYDLGMGIGPFLLGYLIRVTGFRGLYLAMSVIAFLALPIYYFLHGRKKAEVKQTA